MILKATNIEKNYGRKRVLKGVSFALEKGKVYGIVGENGSGKTTLLKSLIGYLKVRKGEVVLNGSFGYCPQIPNFFDQLSVEEHFKYFCAAYDLSFKKHQAKLDHLLEQLNFQKYYKEKVSKLSGGTIQKLNLAIALLNDPDLLILDEPYNGFDWDTYLKFWELTKALQQRNRTVLIVSHFVSERSRFDVLFELTNGQLHEVE